MEAIDELVAAIDGIVDAWEGGDLAGAVNDARETADEWRGPSAGPFGCAECGTKTATTYVVTTLDPQDPKTTRTEVCLPCHEALAKPDRLSTPGKTYDHAARPDDDAEPGDRCRHCGEDVIWVGPHHTDWMHVDDKENR